MPFVQGDVLEYFNKEIRESAEEEINKLKSEIENTKKKQLKEIEDRVKDTVNKVLDIEMNEINTEFSATTNRIRTSAHQEVIRKKHELLDSILLTVRKKCESFAKTKKYQSAMEQLIKKIDKEFCGDSFTFKIRKGDELIKEAISKTFSKNCNVIEDESILVGGFIGVCIKKGILTDQTIDNRLEEARVRLYEKSNLAVK